jgi:phage repressor protein C with HTH and peptisase S24 domain
MKFPFSVRRVIGKSMEPTLKSGNFLLIKNKFKLTPGIIVIADVKNREFVKRVTYLKNNEVFITGDNTAHSTDSRTLGWLNTSQVVGKVIWPRFL